MFNAFDPIHEDFFSARSDSGLFSNSSLNNFTAAALFGAANLDFFSTDFGDHDDDHGDDGHYDIYPHLDGFSPGKDGRNTLDDFDIVYSTNDDAGKGPEYFPGNDIAGNTTTTASLTVGNTLTAEIGVSGDHDWIRVELVAGERYVFTLDGTGGGLALSDPLLQIRDAAGNLLKEDDDGGDTGLNSRLGFVADTTGTYYLDAQAFSTETGQYTLTFDELPPLADFTIDQIADYLTSGSWAERTHNDGDGNTSNGTTISYFFNASITAAEQTLAVAAMQDWASVADLQFVQTGTQAGADLVYENTDGGAYAATTRSGSTIISVRINVSQADWIGTYGTDINSYSYQTYIHEIGHALGLGHGGPYNGSANYNSDAIYANDTWGTTVMSYFNQGEADFGTSRLVLGTQIADILAIQNLYGANTTARGGDSVYGFNTTETGSIFDSQNWANQNIRIPSYSIWDTGGTDTLDFSGYSANQTISLIAETWSSVGDNTSTGSPTDALENIISIARGSVIENGIGGSGNDTIIGNAANNVLTGNAGDDILDGGDGIDYANYVGGTAGSYTITDNNDGTYTVSSATNGTDTLSNIEFVRINGVDQQLGGTPVDNTINGDNGNNTLMGTVNADIINGLGGNDTITGLAGNDVIDGGAGLDTAVFSGAFAAYSLALTSATGITVTHLAGGADGMDMLNNVEFMTFSDGTLLFEDAGRNGIQLTLGADSYTADAGANIINGLSGADLIYGLGGDDILRGGAGNDRLFGGEGADVLDGGQGVDRVYYTGATAGVTANFIDQSLNTGEAAGDTYISIESINGSNFADTITSGNGDNELVGLGGNDVLIGAGGNDRMFGGNGNDRMLGGTGNDIMYGQGGDDTFVIQANAGTDLIYDFVQGSDTIEFIRGPGAFSQLQITTSGNNTIITSILGVTTLVNFTASLVPSDFKFTSPTQPVDNTTYLTNGDDTYYGTSGADEVDGLGGLDTLYGLAGDDILRGGDGDDRLFGGEGADVLDGGAGADRVYYTQATTGVTANLINQALNTGEATGDTYISIESIYGSNFGDFITSGNTDDQLVGLGGDDILVGANGNDRLFGGDGNDRLLGGRDNDDLYGQGGNDTFVIRANAGSDRIFDFTQGGDIIEMNGGPSSFGQLTITTSGSNTVIVSSNGITSLIGFTGTLTAADFTFLNPSSAEPMDESKDSVSVAEYFEETEIDVADPVADILFDKFSADTPSYTSTNAESILMLVTADDIDYHDMTG